jgi:hypothetical protein
MYTIKYLTSTHFRLVQYSLDFKMHLKFWFAWQNVRKKYESLITKIIFFQWCSCLALFDCF